MGYHSAQKITQQEYLKSRVAHKLLALREIRAGNPWPLVYFEWPQLIITDQEELDVFRKCCQRTQYLDLRLDDFQVDFLTALFGQKHTQVGMSGGTKLGKGFVAGGLGVNLWWDCYPDCKIILVGPTAQHVKDNLFGEARVWRKKMWSHEYQLDNCEVQLERMQEIGNETHFVKMANTETGEGLSGTHSTATIWFFDEASGSPEFFYNNALSGFKMLVGLSNPRYVSGWFAKWFPDDFSSGFKTIQASTGPRRLISVGLDDCINVKAKRLMNPISPHGGLEVGGAFYPEGTPILPEHQPLIKALLPGQACFDLREQLVRTCPEDEIEWRVFGRFPKENRQLMLFKHHWRELATKRFEELSPDNDHRTEPPLQYQALGVDVAGRITGDDACLAFGEVRGCAEILTCKVSNLQLFKGLIYAEARIRGMDPLDGITPVAVDTLGMGQMLGDSMEVDGVYVIRVENGKKPERDAETYENRRAEVYGDTASLVDPTFNEKSWAVPDDDMLWEELFAHERIYVGVGRRFRLNPKRRPPSKKMLPITDDRESVEEKIGRSPDRADGLTLLSQAIRVLPEFDQASHSQLNMDELLKRFDDLPDGKVKCEFFSGRTIDIPKEEFTVRFPQATQGKRFGWESAV